MAQKGAGGEQGAVTEKGGSAPGGTDGSKTGGKASGGRSGSPSGGGNSGGSSGQ